jgi:hypothetical protein
MRIIAVFLFLMVAPFAEAQQGMCKNNSVKRGYVGQINGRSFFYELWYDWGGTVMGGDYALFLATDTLAFDSAEFCTYNDSLRIEKRTEDKVVYQNYSLSDGVKFIPGLLQVLIPFYSGWAQLQFLNVDFVKDDRICIKGNKLYIEFLDTPNQSSGVSASRETWIYKFNGKKFILKRRRSRELKE